MFIPQDTLQNNCSDDHTYFNLFVELVWKLSDLFPFMPMISFFKLLHKTEARLDGSRP